MTKKNQAAVFTFFSGFEAYHALLHAFLGVSQKTEIKGHPAEKLGMTVNKKISCDGGHCQWADRSGFRYKRPENSPG